MSRDTLWCQDPDPHDPHTWTDKHEYDFDCSGVGELTPHMRDQVHSSLRDTLDAILDATRAQHQHMRDIHPEDPATAEDLTLGWLMTNFDAPPDEGGLAMTRDDLACLAGFAIFRLISQDDGFLKLAAGFPGAGWLPDERDLQVATRAFHERAQAGAEATPRDHCAALLDAIRADREQRAREGEPS